MERKIYYLSTCDTCKKIISELELKNKIFEFQDIKFKPISNQELEFLHNKGNTYENLFSKTARKYKELNLKNKQLTEINYKELILSDYTFLKRPIIIYGEKIFIGNSKSTIELVKSIIK